MVSGIWRRGEHAVRRERVQSECRRADSCTRVLHVPISHYPDTHHSSIIISDKYFTKHDARLYVPILPMVISCHLLGLYDALRLN